MDFSARCRMLPSLPLVSSRPNLAWALPFHAHHLRSRSLAHLAELWPCIYYSGAVSVLESSSDPQSRRYHSLLPISISCHFNRYNFFHSNLDTTFFPSCRLFHFKRVIHNAGRSCADRCRSKWSIVGLPAHMSTHLPCPLLLKY